MASEATNAANQAAARADREATTATRETQRATSVHGFMVDLFAANSNDQKNAVEVRKLTAKQLLDRGTARLEAAGTGDASVDDSLYALFIAKLYENLADYETSNGCARKPLSASRNATAGNPLSTPTRFSISPGLEAHDVAGKRMDLVREAKAILQKHAAESPALARAWVIEARTIDRARPLEACRRRRRCASRNSTRRSTGSGRTPKPPGAGRASWAITRQGSRPLQRSAAAIRAALRRRQSRIRSGARRHWHDAARLAAPDRLRAFAGASGRVAAALSSAIRSRRPCLEAVCNWHGPGVGTSTAQHARWSRRTAR